VTSTLLSFAKPGVTVEFEGRVSVRVTVRVTVTVTVRVMVMVMVTVSVMPPCGELISLCSGIVRFKSFRSRSGLHRVATYG